MLLIPEDGTGKPDANTYASIAAADAYHEGHLYATHWTAATASQKTAALVMATRTIDAVCQFRGTRANPTQALQWPRSKAIDDDSPSITYFPSDSLPTALIAATIETARELIKTDRTADPEGQGIRTETYYATHSITFDPADRRPVLPPIALALLLKLSNPQPRATIHKLLRT